MERIRIMKNSLGDTRTATRVPDFEEFSKSNILHSDDVKLMMRSFARCIENAGVRHDWTKWREPYKSLFYRELCETIEGKMNFVDGEWYPTHCKTERHHLNEYCPEDVNLIDVIEMICDCVCAGMARSGKFREFKLSDEILQKAVSNTVKMCLESVTIEEDGSGKE